MQTDIWLTQSDQPTQCPLCSKPLKASSKTCYACGFSLESPTSTSTGSSVWIDPTVYTYQPPDPSPSPDAQTSDRSKLLPKSAKPTGSVVWEGTTSPQPQQQTRQRTGGTSIPSTGKHTSPVSKSVARPIHTRRRTYTRSLSQTQDGNPSARPPEPQPPMWQYESPNFEAGSSLPALSLLVAETPTQPGIALPEEEAPRGRSAERTPCSLPDCKAVDAPASLANCLDSAERVAILSGPYQSAKPAERSGAYINPSIPTDDSWIVGTVEADISTSLPDSSPRTAPQTRRLLDIAGIADIADVPAIDEIDTVPERIATRSAESRQFANDAGASTALQSGKLQGVRSAEQAPAPSRTLNASHTPYAHVDEIDTVPELNQASHTLHTPYAHVDQIDTLPERIATRSAEQAPSRALVPVTPQIATIPATDLASWTAGGSGQSSYARHIADRTRRKKPHAPFSLNPFDSVRWWLLRPGRIEFILWLGGTILLITVTCVLLLVTAFSLNWITPGLRSSVTSSPSSLTGTSSQGHALPTITSTPGLVFTLLDNSPLLPGQPIHVHGQGFTPNGKVVFTLDGPQLPLNPNGPTASVRSNAHGEFTATLSLGYGPAWTPGIHLIIAHDISGRLAVLSFTVTQGPFGKSATATPVPVTPGTTVTPTPGKSGGGNPTPTPISTPVNSTPGPSTPTPTVGTTPTPVPTKTPTPTPIPSPTVGTTLTPTPGTTPTPKPSPTAAVPPSSSPTAAVPLSSTHSGDSGPSDGLSNALGNSNTPAFNTELARLAPWLWLPMLFYTLSMLMLGLAGVLHKRRR